MPNRFHPKGYKKPIFGKKKPVGTWEITKTEYVKKDSRWPDLEKNKKLWKRGMQICVNCKKEIPNPKFYDHVTSTCPNLQIPYINKEKICEMFTEELVKEYN